jgi:hypothetical protein
MRRAAALVCAAFFVAGCGSERNAVAPGRHVVFARGLDLPSQSLWIADVDGGHQRRLVRRAALGRISPDGRYVAFDRDLRRDAYVVGSDGSGERLVAHGVDLLDWTRDGRRLLVLRRGALATVDVESRTVTTLDAHVLDRRTRETEWSFSPDGRRLVYAKLTGRSLGYACYDGADLYVVQLDGTHRRPLFADGRSSYPVWGRGGIAFRRDLHGCTSGGLWRIRADGTDLRPLLLDVPARYTHVGYYGLVPYTWLDRDRLVIGIHNEWGDDAAVLAHGRIRRLGMQIDTTSRDGRFLLGAQAGAEFPFAIAIGSIDGGRRRVVARGRVCCPDWNR